MAPVTDLLPILLLLAPSLYVAVSGEPVDCFKLKQVFPMCQCYAALDDEGAEMVEAVVDCEGRDLTTVPSPTQAYDRVIYELRLRKNKIQSLGSNAFSGLRIRKLDLKDNSITSVANDTFTGLGNSLVILHMDGNGISPPPSAAFTYLNNVEELVLRKYQLPVLENRRGVFLAFRKLKHLTLDDWKIQSIEPGSFHGPEKLLSLTLTKQPLTQLPIDELREPELRYLKKLKISFTPIITVTHSVFGALDELSELDLSENHIEMLEDDCFRNVGDTLTKLSLKQNILSSDNNKLLGLRDMTNLQELDLSVNNDVITIPNFARLGVTKPIKINLSNNKITSLQANAFVGIADKVHTLDLTQNEISATDNGAFNGMTALQVLYIKDQRGTSSTPFTVPSSLQQAAGSLSQLYLNGQRLEPNSLWSVVGQLRKLTVLDLGSTKLTSVPRLALENLTSLHELNLGFNRLTSLQQEALVGPRATLKSLNLEANQLTRLPACLFHNYTSYPITLMLKFNPLICDCDIKWLWDDIQNQKIQFFQGQQPECKNLNNSPLSSLQEATFCSSSPAEPQCGDYYTTSATAAPVTTPSPAAPRLTINIVAVKTTSITMAWTLSERADLRSFNVEVSNSYGDSEFRSLNLGIDVSQMVATGLMSDTHHTLCVTAVFNTLKLVKECSITRTQKEETTTDKQTGSGGSEDVGIIIGAVVGSVALLAILAAIAYLILIRKQPKKNPSNDMPVQPRNFSKAELPSMSGDTRSFAKTKRANGDGATGGMVHRDGMQVVAISDGQTSNGRVGRAYKLNSDGSYNKHVSDDSYKSMSDFRSSSTSGASSLYENGHGALPPLPPDNPPTRQGYYNMGFRDDKYDEIDTQKEIVL